MNQSNRKFRRRAIMLVMSALFTVSAVGPTVASAATTLPPADIQKPGH